MNKIFNKTNLPNIISTGRIILTIIFIILMSLTFKYNIFIANVLFIIASGTDFLDGYYARKYNVVSNIGKILDPLADKILVNSAYIFLASVSLIQPWICVIIISREIAITSLRIFATDLKIIIPANKFGKIKTVLLTVVSSFLLDKLSMQTDGIAITYPFFKFNIDGVLYALVYILLYLSTFYSLFSFYTYIKAFKNKLIQ